MCLPVEVECQGNRAWGCVCGYVHVEPESEGAACGHYPRRYRGRDHHVSGGRCERCCDFDATETAICNHYIHSAAFSRRSVSATGRSRCCNCTCNVSQGLSPSYADDAERFADV